ncbi:MAG TPA: hypothetical protein VMF56_05665 [Acidobacteriaceae bacterium]|nr:hypothetical protein [Acidobacteriaceae bacterium]
MQILNDNQGNPVQIWVAPPALGVTVDYWIGPANPYFGTTVPPPAAGYFWVPLPIQNDYPEFGANYTDWIWLDTTDNQLQFGKSITVTASGNQLGGNGAVFFFYYATP